jgi:hypothetical protein
VVSFGNFSVASNNSMCPGWTQPLTNECQEAPGGKDGRCVRLTTYHLQVPISRNLEALTSPEPSGPHRPVMGMLCRLLCRINLFFVSKNLQNFSTWIVYFKNSHIYRKVNFATHVCRFVGIYIGNAALLKTCLLGCYAVSTGVYFPKCSKKRSSFFFRFRSKRKCYWTA